MITGKQMIDMFASQEATCTLYTGKDWRKKTSLAKFIAAADGEWAEFLEETTLLWKWYAHDKVLNRQKALYELVDFIMFVLAMKLHDSRVQDIEKTDEWLDPGTAYHTMDNLIGIKVYMFRNIVMNINEDSVYSDISDIIMVGCRLLDYKLEDFFKAFYHKNEICANRVAGGKKYDKSKEVLLYGV